MMCMDDVTMLIIILEALHGRDHSLYLLGGKYVEIREVASIMLTITLVQQPGKDLQQNDCNISNTGRVKEHMS